MKPQVFTYCEGQLNGGLVLHSIESICSHNMKSLREFEYTMRSNGNMWILEVCSYRQIQNENKNSKLKYTLSVKTETYNNKRG